MAGYAAIVFWGLGASLAAQSPAPPPSLEPSMEMLLYLSEFSDSAGEHIDPQDAVAGWEVEQPSAKVSTAEPNTPTKPQKVDTDARKTKIISSPQ